MADSLREPASTPPTKASAVVAPTAVLVLGMHRSGTSAFTRVLNLLGVDLGSDLLRPTKDNEKGYWEHRGVVRIHERILESLDRAWSDISPLPPDWTGHDGVPALLDELQILLRQEFEGERLWGVKDPRLCELLSGWKQILSSMGVRPCAAVVVRNPLDVAKSIAKRDGISRVKALAMWLRYLLDSEIESRDVDRVFLSYEALLGDWRVAVQKVGETLGIRWPRELDEIGADVDSFLDPSLRHSALDPVFKREDVNSHVRDAYAALVRADWRDSQELRAEFDRIASEVDRSGGNSGAILRAVEKEHRRDAKRIEKEGRARARKLSKAVDDFRRSGDSLRAQNDRLRSDLGAAQAEMRRLMDEARAAKRETAREGKLRNKAEKQIRRAQRLADDAVARAQALGRELHGFRTRASLETPIAPGDLETPIAPGDLEGLRSAELERAKSYFDRDWYVAKYPESAEGPLEPFAYYVTVGWRREHRPSPAFDPGHYRLAEPESADACPLIRFVAHERDSGTGPNALFDPLFYQSQLNPQELRGLTPFQHYLSVGWLSALRPHPLFDSVRYQEQLSEDVQVCPLLHYLAAGPSTDVSPHPLFHAAFYRSQLEADELGESTPLEHYLTKGWKRKLQPHPLFREGAFIEGLPPGQRAPQERLSQYLSSPALQTVGTHPLFDPDHYLAECRAVGHLPEGPLLLDYLTTGWRCGASPHPLVELDDDAGVESAEEAAADDPLTAYLIAGDAPGADPHVWFDGSFYRRSYGDRIPDGISALEHFAIEGHTGEFDPIEWFDARFYLETHLPGETGINPLVHFIREGYAAGLSPNRLFVGDDYLELNPDVSKGDEPLHRWLESGREEGRPTISTKSLLIELSSLTPPADSFDVRTFSEAEIESLRQSLAGRRIAVLVNSKADAVTTEVAANLVQALWTVAPDVTKVDCAFADRNGLPDADAYLVVAPHRTLALGDGARFASRLDWRKTIVVNAEPIHSRFFHAARPFLKQARLVLDANRHTAALLTKYERPVLFLPLSSPFSGVEAPSTLPADGLARGLCRATRAYDPATETSLFDRPIDLAFLGSRTSRREEFFANANRVFAERNAVIHLETPHGFGVSGDISESAIERASFENAIGRRTKFLLNVHPDDFPAFDWHRIVSRGIAQGAVVVSEPTLPTPVFEAGTHYLEENLRAMPDLVRWLLSDDEGRLKAEAIRRAAAERHRACFSAEQQGARLVSMLRPFVSLGSEPSSVRAH